MKNKLTLNRLLLGILFILMNEVTATSLPKLSLAELVAGSTDVYFAEETGKNLQEIRDKSSMRSEFKVLKSFKSFKGIQAGDTVTICWGTDSAFGHRFSPPQQGARYVLFLQQANGCLMQPHPNASTVSFVNEFGKELETSGILNEPQVQPLEAFLEKISRLPKKVKLN